MLNYKKSNPTIDCRDTAEIFNIGKASAVTIIKSEEKLRKDYAIFEGNRKQICHGKFHRLNEAMYLWYKKCCAANLYPTGALIQEGALLMKEKMIETKNNFKTTHVRYERQKLIYHGKAGDIPVTMVKAYMGRLPELVKGCSLEDVLNRDEMGLDTATERTCRKGEKRKRWKTKFGAANGSKVCDPIVVWRSKKPCCFRKLKSIYHSHGVHYFANAKAWMTTEIMQELLMMLDKK